MSCGDLTGYIANNPEADRLNLVGVFSTGRTTSLRHHQLSDVAGGLNYLHFCDVIHGDLKGVSDCYGSCLTTALTSSQTNVLVDTTGRAQITDFGLATFTQDLDSMRNTSAEDGDSARWIAPEIFDRGTYSKESDVFSFAMVMIEVRCRPPTWLASGELSFI